MKATNCIKAFAALVLMGCAMTTMAQSEHLKQIQKVYDDNQPRYHQLYQERKYKEAEAPLTTLINYLDSIATCKYEDIPETQIKDSKCLLQYDLACCYALQGKKKDAMAMLTQSVDNGYKLYDNMLNDTDFKSLSKDKRFKALLETVRSRQPIEVLKKSNAYKAEETNNLPEFMYQPKEHSNLKLVREYFQLDTIPGKGNELDHIKNLLHFAHDNIRHDGSNFAACEFTAIDIYNYSRSTGRGVNCRQLALSLCEMYLAMGYKARVVTCLPADPNDYECHVINTVWSETLNKWLYIDPTMDAWVMDENGMMLSIAEVRERLIDGRPLVLCETANWNHENPQTKGYYLDTYMAKNLYYFVCKNRSFFNQESRYRSIDNQEVRLIPEGFVNDNFKAAATTTDPALFWVAPK